MLILTTPILWLGLDNYGKMNFDKYRMSEGFVTGYAHSIYFKVLAEMGQLEKTQSRGLVFCLGTS